MKGFLKLYLFIYLFFAYENMLHEYGSTNFHFLHEVHNQMAHNVEKWWQEFISNMHNAMVVHPSYPL